MNASPILIGGAMALAGILLSLWLSSIVAQRHLVESRGAVLQQLGTVRAAVERSLNERIYLTLGLRAFVSTHPDLTTDEFSDFASALMAEGEGIRSVTLIKDNVISDVYPRAGNEPALGSNLLEIPKQRADVLRAIETRQPWLSAPIDLVQGGEAFVNRAPVFLTPPKGAPGSGRYWGLVSILISKTELLDEIVDGLPESLSLAMRVQSDDDPAAVYYFGDQSIERESPLSLDVNLPTGDWQVIGAPATGWPSRSRGSIIISIFGSLASIGLACLTYMLLRSNAGLREARSAAEDAVQQLSRKNEDLETFIRSASHDLRAPIRHIDSYAQIVMEDAATRLTADENEHLRRLRKSSQAMTRLLDSLLRFAKTGVEGLRFETVELNDVVLEVVDRLPRDSASWVQSADLPVVQADRELITQVFGNLIENALKYNRSADPHVIVAASVHDESVAISLTDNGIGMSVGELDRVFQPGVRGLHARDFEGTGFGLAICDRIVKSHNGKLSVESEPGRGSTFLIQLPKQPHQA